MITSGDSINTIETDAHYTILPSLQNNDKMKYLNHYNAKDVKKGFEYNSNNNTEWISVQELREQIKKYVDPDFKI